jgi:hypothetical protein
LLTGLKVMVFCASPGLAATPPGAGGSARISTVSVRTADVVLFPAPSKALAVHAVAPLSAAVMDQPKLYGDVASVFLSTDP